jgi:hypothetical protein
MNTRLRRPLNKVTSRDYDAISGACGITEQINSPLYDY